MENGKPEPKFSTAEIIFLGIFYIALDIADYLTADLPLSDVFSWISQFYYTTKGVSGTRMIIGNILEIIPGLDLLPIRTVTFIMTIWADRHPKIKAAAEIAGGRLVGANAASRLERSAIEETEELSAAGAVLETDRKRAVADIPETSFGMPRSAYEEMDAENFDGNSGDFNGYRQSKNEDGKNKEETGSEEEEYQLEKSMGGGQLTELKRSLENPLPEEENGPGETIDLRNGKKAA